MATLFKELFEGGLDGEPVTTETTSFTSMEAGTPVHSSSHAAEGTLGMLCSPGTTITRCRWEPTSPAPELWIQTFVQVVSAPASHSVIMAWHSAAGQVGDIQIRSGGQIAIRAGFTLAWQSSKVFTESEWVRIQFRVQQGQPHQMRLFYGDNLYGEVPDEDSGPTNAGNNNPVTHIFFGCLVSNSFQVAYDAIEVDDSQWPASPVQESDPVARLLTPTGWVDLGHPELLTA